MAQEPTYEKDYVVLSPRCVYGSVGETVKLTMTEGQELSLLQSGAVRLSTDVKLELRGEPGPEVVQLNRPTVAVKKEGKHHG
jgi:hypothetical protein